MKRLTFFVTSCCSSVDCHSREQRRGQLEPLPTPVHDQFTTAVGTKCKTQIGVIKSRTFGTCPLFSRKLKHIFRFGLKKEVTLLFSVVALGTSRNL
ncbi:hypothetical protein R3I94_014178 [Phoxinus phoxinus]